jgi:nitrogen fixation protein NifU and related proteins
MDDELTQLYQEIILDHSRKPRNFRVLPDASHHAEGHNPLCGDRYTVYVRVEGDAIKDVSFQGSGCAISKAAASIMTDQIKGKTITEARHYFEGFQKLVTTGKSEDEEKLGKLAVFAGVSHFPMRVKCAALPWHAMLASLKDAPSTVSTETHDK